MVRRGDSVIFERIVRFNETTGPTPISAHAGPTVLVEDRNKSFIGNKGNSVCCKFKGKTNATTRGKSNFFGTKGGSKEMAFDYRSKTTKQNVTCKVIQIRGVLDLFEDGRTKLVDNNIRPKRRLSSYINGGKSAKVTRVCNWNKLVSLSRTTVWPKPSGMDIFKGYEGPNRALEVPWNILWEPCGRHLGRPPKSGSIIGNKRPSNIKRLKGLRVHLGRKRAPRAHTKSKILWVHIGHSFRKRYCPRNKNKRNIVRPKRTPIQTATYSSPPLFNYRQVNKPKQGLQVFKSSVLRTLLNNRCRKQEALGMGYTDTVNTPSNYRYKLDHKKFKEKERKSRVEARTGNGTICGRVHNGLVRDHREKTSVWKLGSLPQAYRYCGPRVYGNTSWPRIIRSSHCRPLRDSFYRQPSSQKDDGVRRKKALAEGDNERSMEFLRVVRYPNSRIPMGTFTIKPSGRVNKIVRRNGLDTFSRTFRVYKSKVGPILNRSNGKLSFKKSRPFQQSVSLPGDGSSRLLHAKLEKRKQLRLLPPRPASQSVRTGYAVQGHNNINNSSLAFSTVVAYPSSTKNRDNRPSPRNQKLYTKSMWELAAGTLEKSKLEVPSNKNLFLKSLSLRVNKVLSPNSPYEKRLHCLWREFTTFCELHEITACPAEPETILMFLMWENIIERSLNSRLYLTAISRYHQIKGFRDPTLNFNVQNLARKLSKQIAENKEATWPRDPLPTEALKNYVDNPPCNTPRSIWKRDCALVALGLRTMRRPSELCNLKVGDLKMVEGICWVRINRSKTDQFAKGKFIPVDPTNSRYCPIKLVFHYLSSRGKVKRNDWLFVNIRGNRMTTGTVNSIVKKMALHAGLEGRYSGHSIRIGGATGAMKAGLTLPQIMSIGGWLSQSVALYLRSFSTVLQNTSIRMGF